MGKRQTYARRKEILDALVALSNEKDRDGHATEARGIRADARVIAAYFSIPVPDVEGLSHV